MSEEVELAGTPADEQVQEQVEQVESEATAENVEEVTETPEEKAKKEPWFQKRIGELTREKYEAKRQAETAAQEAQQLREYLESVNQGEAQPVGDVQALVKAEAAKLLAEKSFNESCNKVYATGKAEFPDFDSSVANLQMVGMNRDFLDIVSSSDAGHKVLHHLGNDLDEAARIAALPPLQMARELTRLEYKLGQTQAKPVSKAPAPIKPIGAGGSTYSGLSDDLPIDEWMRRRNKERFGK